jgi:putative pyruvate formate lyase activating enzyme
VIAVAELERRAREAYELLGPRCTVCPRLCKVDRREDVKGLCAIGRHAVVASHFPHFGEENCLRGRRGSGTIFFSGCNLRCVFCQNHDISWQVRGERATPERLATMMVELQAIGCHNINWVTPEHVVPQILEALPLAVQRGLRLPIVYNTSSYDSIDSLELMDGIVDIYMPDFKLWSSELARRYLAKRDYAEVARHSVREMHRQVGDLVFDEHGMARRGLLVRHLVMPGLLGETEAILRFVADELGLRARARFHSFALAGDDPITMLTGPIPATRKALERSGLGIDDIDLIEVNEAFAPVVLAWREEHSADLDRVNVNGGAMALGHPLGASGARLLTTLVNALEQTGGRYGLQTMCEGGGLANATIIERLG